MPKEERACRNAGASSRAARRLAVAHIRRFEKHRELGGAQHASGSPTANGQEFFYQESDFPSLSPSAPKPTGHLAGTLPSLKTVNAAGRQPTKGCGPRSQVRASPSGGLSGEDRNDDGWKGKSFLERVSLAALAAAAVSKKDANRHAVHEMAVRGDAAAMKRQSAAHRGNWILRSGSRVDAQLSFVGRALPPASREAAGEALKQHEVDYTSSFNTDAVHLTAIRSFAGKWAKEKLVKLKVNLEPPAWPSGSSCFERTSRKGGTLSYLLEKSSEQEAPTHYLSDAVAAEVAQDISQFSYALKEFKKREIPLHRVACITERGLKTRVVNVGPAWCQVLGHSVRKHLLRGLRATQGAYQPLVGAKDGDILRLFEGSCGDVLVSTDLTRATDLLPLDLVSAVVEGLSDSGRLSKLEVDVLRALTGPQDLLYPSRGEEAVRTSRGILMGLPTSWCILSLIHLYWLDVAKGAALEAAGRRKPRIRFAICGDDALLSTNVEGAAAYKQIVSDCGGIPSAGKHYECASGGLRRAVFLERLYEWEVLGNGKLGSGIRFAAIPVKGFTSRNLPRDFLEDRLVSCRSFGIRQILGLDSLLSQNPILEGPLRDYMIRRVAWLPKYAEQVLGLIGGFPLKYGGFALSPRPSDVSRAVWVRDAGRSFSLAIQRELDPCWRMAVSFQEGGRELAIQEGELVDLPLTWVDGTPATPGWVVVEEDHRFLRTVLPIYRQVVSFSTGVNRRTIHLRASDFRRSLAKLRAEGKLQPSGLDVDVPVGPRRIEWRLPNRETPERGLSWYDATEFNRSAYLTEVLELLLEDLDLASSYRYRLGYPEALPAL